MPKPRKRWVCPLCAGGKLAPSRPRKNDTRRYCLPCSEKTGRLVERFCPAHERAKERKRQRRQQKRTPKPKPTTPKRQEELRDNKLLDLFFQ